MNKKKKKLRTTDLTDGVLGEREVPLMMMFAFKVILLVFAIAIKIINILLLVPILGTVD